MIIEPNLNRAMRTFFDRVSNFDLAAGDEISVAVMPYPENLDLKNGCPVVRRYRDAKQASRVTLRKIGPACELYVAIVQTESELYAPVGKEAVVGSWEMRERTEAESGLRCLVWVAQGSHPHEPLVLSSVYPADDRRVCQATVWYPPRYRALGISSIAKL